MADHEMRLVLRNYFLNGSTISACKSEMDRLYGHQSPTSSTINTITTIGFNSSSVD